MNTAKPLLRTLSKNLVRSSALCLALLSAATVRAQTPWLNETFGGYTNGQPLSLALSPQLINVTSPTNFTKINNDGGNVARYQKISSTGTASAPNFAFSATNNIIARTNGYVAFKLKQNTDTLAPANMTNQSWYMGIANTNPTASVNTSANRIISMQFKQSGGAPAVVSVESSGTSIVSSYNWTNSTSYALVQIWFNDSDTAPMSYTTPSGAVSTLATNCFVVYIDTNLVTTTNSGNAPLTGAGGTSLSIGKMGLGTGSTITNIDFSFGNLYAADSAPGPTNAPTITSATNATASLNFPFSYQITTDPLGATSYALVGTLPDGLAFNSTTGVISGTPTTLGGPTTVVLTASNSVGTGAPINLAITVSLPVNVFSGSNPSLDTSASWSLQSPPTKETSIGSFTDLVFAASGGVTNLTATTGYIRGKSWNATNGLSYNFSSVFPSNQTIFRIGNTGSTDTYPYSNAVAGAANVMLFLTNGSKLTFAPTNSASGGTNSIVQVRNSGIMLIDAGSVADFQAPVTNSSPTNVLTKSGNGTLVFGARSYNFSGTTALEAGTLRFSDTGSSGTNTAGTFTLAGGTVEAMADYDLGHAYGTVTNNGTNTWEKLDGQTTTISGAVTLSAAPGVTLALYKLAGTTNSANVVTKTGSGTLQLRGGGVPSIIADWLLNDGTLFVNTTASGGLGTNNSVIMNGGNILFSKGVSSTGTYTGQGQDVGLQVRQNGTITLNANTNTAPSNNTVSFTNLVISNQTLTVVKGAEAFCSTNPGYTDPQISFRAATLNDIATLSVGTNAETVLQGGTGTGGVTKSGAGKLTISSGSFVTNSVTNSIANSYTGPTTVSAGTLQLGGSHASSITIGASAVLESTLTTNSPATAGSLNFVSGAKVRIAGTASQSSYTLVTASNGIVGLPTLETAVPDYALSVSNNSLLLVATSAPLSPYGSWLTNYPSLTGSNTNGTADPDGDGFNNNMEFAFDGNPTVGSPAMISVASSGASSVFSFLASTNTAAVSYMVQSTTNLATGPWGDNSGVTATITNSANQANVPLYPSYLRREFRVTPTGTNSFYRVKATISQ